MGLEPAARGSIVLEAGTGEADLPTDWNPPISARTSAHHLRLDLGHAVGLAHRLHALLVRCPHPTADHPTIDH